MKPDLYTRLYLWLIARRRSVLFLTLLIMAVSIVISSRIRLEEDILDILPKNDQRVEEYKYALRKFRQIDRVYIDVGVNTNDPDKLGSAADELFAGLSTNDAFLKITYRFEISGQTKVVDYLTGALPNLFTDADAAALEKKLEPAEVRSYLTTMRRKLAGPEGMVLKEVVAADPIGSAALVLAKVTPLQTGFGDAQVVDGRITSSDGRHVLMMAEPKFSSSNSRNSEALVREMLQLAGDVENHFPGVHVAITGGHRMSVDNAKIIKTDATRCIVIGTAGMIVLCVAGFRRRWLSLITFLPSLFSTVVAGVVLALWQRHLSAIATGFATIALGITVDYAIYIIYHLDDAASSDPQRVGRHLSQLVFPIVIGALTTIAAFLVMMVSPIQGYQQLGVFGAIGVVFSVAFAIVILPLMVPMAKTSGQPPLWLTRWWEGYFDWQTRRRPWLIAFVIVVTIVTAFGVRRLRFDGDIAKLNGIREETRRDDALISETWGGALNMTLVVARGATPEEALAKNDHAAEVLARISNVAEIYSLASVCPSPATQAANLKRWHEFWTPARRDAMRQTLVQIGGELGFRSDAFAKFWQTVEKEPPLLTPEFFHGTPLEQALNERVAFGNGDNAVSTLIKLKDREQVDELRQSLAGFIVLDHRDFIQHIARLARSGLRNFAVWTAILVAGILYLTMASVELVIATLLPLAFGMLWTFGAMGWLGLSINLMNSVFVIFIIGVAEDYSVFLVTSKVDEWRGLPKLTAVNCASVLISALTTIFGIGVLVIAKHPVLYSMGTTVLLGMVAAFIATLILTPFCMELLLFKDPPTGAPRWWHPFGTLWVTLYLGTTQFFLYYVLRPLLKIFSPRTALDRVRRATRGLARVLVKSHPFGKLEFQNIRPGTFSQSCIVISNHQSAVDVMLMVSLPGDVRQTAKKRVFDAPMLGVGCKVLGHVQVEPSDPETTLRRCRERLAEGASVHFYPEGTRSPDGFVRRFHRGAFELAVELNQEILPIIICDSNTAVPRDAYWFEPFHTTVTALPRVTPQNFDYSQGIVALMRHCEDIVREGLQRQLDQLNTPRVVRRKVNRLYRYQGKFVEQFVYWKLKTDPVFEALDQVVPRQGFILDLGCGYGIATHWLASYTDGRTFLGVDYDEVKIRVARRSVPGHDRIQFEPGDILQYAYPECDVILLLDVLHYWTPAKQQAILDRARRALRPGGRLILRDGARAENAAHRRVDFWERIATRIGHNQTVEGLHFQTLAELEAAIKQAGFASWELKREAGRDSNVMWVANA